MWIASWWSCAWISLDQHRANQGALDGEGIAGGTELPTDGPLPDTEPPGGDDDDTVPPGGDDDDDDTVPSDSGSSPGTTTCADDGYEPNDVAAAAAPIGAPPASIAAVTCPGSRVDRYAVTVPGDGWIDVALESADCERLMLTVTGPGGSSGQMNANCPTFSEQAPATTYEVRVAAFPAGYHAYAVDVAWTPCDADADAATIPRCGGLDCDDADATVGPDGREVPANGVDEDCDGGDQLQICPPVGLGDALPEAEGRLRCGDPAVDAVWDRWEVPVGPGSSVSVRVDNVGGAADPLVLLVDPDGTSHLDLDDESACSASPGGLGNGCPDGCAVLGPTGGTASVWVAQHDALACTDAPYQLWVQVDGVSTPPVLTSDDGVLAWP